MLPSLQSEAKAKEVQCQVLSLVTATYTLAEDNGRLPCIFWQNGELFLLFLLFKANSHDYLQFILLDFKW